MTNETTASQPKSIGDDAQFKHLSENILRCVTNGARLTALNDLTDYIDNFRAPAAQASATIQAAPTVSTITLTGHQLVEALDLLAPGLPRDPEELDGDLTFGVVQHEGDDGQAAIGMCCWNDDTDGVLPLDEHPTPAATIQEPVMVAEPVGDCEKCEGGTLYNTEHTRSMPCPFCKPAAPMVADPASVVSVQELSELVERALALPKSLATRSWELTPIQLGWIVGQVCRSSVTATVKAVPSEALDLMKEARELAPILRGMCEGGGADRGDDIYAADYQAPDGDVFVIRAAELLADFAAPLADKTGGGE